MTTALSILGFAALFALFALFGALRPRRSCQNNCDGCSNGCGVTDTQGHT